MLYEVITAFVLVLERVRVPEVLRGALEPEIRRKGMPRAEEKQDKKDREGRNNFV